jgi:hypothetical protein
MAEWSILKDAPRHGWAVVTFMDDQVRHCPFLNREDARCARHLSLGGLDHAYDHCFAAYTTCTVYFDLLVERRVRRTDMYVQVGLPNRGAAA